MCLETPTSTPPHACPDLHPLSLTDLPSPRSLYQPSPTQYYLPATAIPHHWSGPPVTTSYRHTAAHRAEALPHLQLALPPNATPAVVASTLCTWPLSPPPRFSSDRHLIRVPEPLKGSLAMVSLLRKRAAIRMDWERRYITPSMYPLQKP